MVGTGHYSLARGAISTIQGIGGSASQFVAGYIVTTSGYNNPRAKSPAARFSPRKNFGQSPGSRRSHGDPQRTFGISLQSPGKITRAHHIHATGDFKALILVLVS
jgi:hypothetical protein